MDACAPMILSCSQQHHRTSESSQQHPSQSSQHHQITLPRLPLRQTHCVMSGVTPKTSNSHCHRFSSNWYVRPASRPTTPLALCVRSVHFRVRRVFSCRFVTLALFLSVCESECFHVDVYYICDTVNKPLNSMPLGQRKQNEMEYPGTFHRS